MIFTKLKWFTLIELLIVIVIVGVLAVALIPRLTGAQARARDTARIADLRQVQNAIALYYADNWKYPGNELSAFPLTMCLPNARTGILSPLITGWYISSLPQDPRFSKGDPYCYHYYAGTAAPSWIHCNGRTRTDYQYSIFFALETNYPGALKRTDALSASGFSATHCVVGDLK